MAGHVVIGQGNCFKLKESRFRLDTRKKYFTMRTVKHRLPSQVIGALCLGQAGWGFEQPDLVENVTAHCREVGL